MKKFDYNLVKLLQCLIEFRSVTRTAEELDVAISTVRHGLARLRREFNDRIVVNTKEGLVPTTLAITLNSHFSSAANLIDNAIAAGKNSDSAQNSLTINQCQPINPTLVKLPNIPTVTVQRYGRDFYYQIC
ncbi:TPA: LysR family transcriptional regulator [Yersinia enterocolitica]|uniref:Transcriptional regulator, LysR family n=2 Tax=Yersinia enterocolitica TaxID=630 RepID=A0A0H3P0A6_YERE1|nr:LysR family transcriptional regulator [Yersinia enterocolitica]EHB19005.1 LysR family transcriptional regulator [Yersinia enterocolitica subsp. palearctica PhRBD_Ye1]EKN3316250.1 LysR family transcriptional regulator [Yersinia enterocolitica]EKN3320118.1 LysR family transcriptional regulator [Yersinia enterocolitica]EKN3324048.1 LysR family transcriptional regulator [Yersinia enterocolitica]EKN3336065.1 LysR family transcriptional regulator [Yersinia enterocolitica]